mmetsp:Transcript_8863/g.16943  ORF Transcript_8863/g.16943 Transcript_8863/m.16943 type:complete len:219 (-) Transcript_8863:3838-4494(-)
MRSILACCDWIVESFMEMISWSTPSCCLMLLILAASASIETTSSTISCSLVCAAPSCSTTPFFLAFSALYFSSKREFIFCSVSILRLVAVKAVDFLRAVHLASCFSICLSTKRVACDSCSSNSWTSSPAPEEAPSPSTPSLPEAADVEADAAAAMRFSCSNSSSCSSSSSLMSLSASEERHRETVKFGLGCPFALSLAAAEGTRVLVKPSPLRNTVSS